MEILLSTLLPEHGSFMIYISYNFQGCSSSVSKAALFNRQQFDCNVFHETTTSLKFPGNEENNNLIVADGISDTSDSIAHSKTNDLQVNQAHILIISRESSITSTGSSDFMPNNVVRQRSGSVTSGSRIWTPRRNSVIDIRNAQENRVIKSALKTGRTAANGHLLVNRPIKSVTFLDAVTVVTVY